MAYQTINEFNATGLDGVMGYASSISPGFFPLVLFAIFIITTMGAYYSQLRLTGKTDFLASATAASYFTTMIAFVLSLIDGVLNPVVVAISFVITIIFTMILITSDK